MEKRMRRKDIIKENRRRLSAKRTARLFIILIFTLLTTVGCSGGGGSILGISPQVDKLLENGWHSLRSGQNDAAIVDFTEIIHASPDRWEETSALAGLGWAYSNINDAERAIGYYKLIEDKTNDGNLGYAAVLLNRGKDGDYAKALKLLKNIHLDSLDQSFYSENNMDISDAEVHALMAIAYYYNGYREDAYAQINKAKDLDVTNANDKVQKIYKALVEDLKIY
jgi:tetratricopeptide (TPR) repeat protein